MMMVPFEPTSRKRFGDGFLAFYEQVTFKPTSKTVEVLYHGAFNPNRGIEGLILSVADWCSKFSLVLRRGVTLPTSASYVNLQGTRAYLNLFGSSRR